MASPIVVDIPHTIGAAEARRRIDAGIPKIERNIPGGGEISTTWASEDHMTLAVKAMGQAIAGDIQIGERNVRLTVTLPLMLGMMSGMIATTLQKTGEKMLAPPA